MSHLDPERLALIAIGEEPTVEEQRHLAECDRCVLELAELEHTVIVGRSTAGLSPVEAPPDRVWDRIAEELQLTTAGAAAGGPSSSAPRAAAGETPDAAQGQGVEPPARHPWLRRTLFVLAASVALILVAVGTWNLVRPPQTVQVAAATLAAFPDHPGATGKAVVTERPDGEREVSVELDASTPGDGFREVWLITSDASALVSLGVLEGREGTFAVPADIDLHDYVLVDISEEPPDGNPAHSGDSIVRGELGFV